MNRKNTEAKPSRDSAAGAAPIVIRKYANRRLYNTAASGYVTLDELGGMVREGVEFIVQDARSGKDITRQILTQIIVEQESRGEGLLPVRFLRRLIGFYGDSLQGFIPSYLEMSMESFAREQDQLRDRLADSFGGRRRLHAFEDQVRRNLTVFEETLRMFSPFGTGYGTGDRPPEPPSRKPRTPTPPESDKEIALLKRQLSAMQERLDALSSDPADPPSGK